MARNLPYNRLANIRDMAENLMKCPANEAYLSHALVCIAQGFRDIADELEARAAQKEKE